jgi:hypothetical protein
MMGVLTVENVLKDFVGTNTKLRVIVKKEHVVQSFIGYPEHYADTVALREIPQYKGLLVAFDFEEVVSIEKFDEEQNRYVFVYGEKTVFPVYEVVDLQKEERYFISNSYRKESTTLTDLEKMDKARRYEAIIYREIEQNGKKIKKMFEAGSLESMLQMAKELSGME